MFRRLLCWIGWHDWGYVDRGVTHHFTKVWRPSRKEVNHLNDTGHLNGEYQCTRCGELP